MNNTSYNPQPDTTLNILSTANAVLSIPVADDTSQVSTMTPIITPLTTPFNMNENQSLYHLYPNLNIQEMTSNHTMRDYQVSHSPSLAYPQQLSHSLAHPQETI